MNDIYLDTVRLLLSIAPDVFDTPNFAMKGGTAINLFLQDLPRLSVDIDVVYTDHVPDRDVALKHIGEELARAKAAIEKQGFHAKISESRGQLCLSRHAAGAAVAPDRAGGTREVQCRRGVADPA